MSVVESATEGNVPAKPARHKRGCLFWITRGGAALIGFVFMLGMCGVVYQVVATESDLSAYPPPGQIVDVGDYNMHLYCVGEGSPTVILEAGGSLTSSSWAWVQPEIAQVTRVCAYDRAGYGWSDLSLVGYGSVLNSTELHILLDLAGIEGPYILAGHSLGGLYARVYAQQYPDEVVGLVQIDATHPDAWQRRGLREGAGMDRVFLEAGPIAATFSVLRFIEFVPIDTDLPERQQAEMRAYFATTRFANAALILDNTFPEILAPAREITSFGDLPLVVLTTGEVDAAATPDDQILRELQQELVNLSTNSVYRVVEGATPNSLVHNREHAQAAIDAILQVIEAVRTGQPLVQSP